MTAFYLVVEQVETITEEVVASLEDNEFTEQIIDELSNLYENKIHSLEKSIMTLTDYLNSHVEVEMKKELFNNYLELIQKQFLEFVESIKIK
ncbi:6901_t:CDS:2 [Cetraspora pellucida]|uniref:6901_t:CDS:1 n=1 Tax=Cetraspora pellucida TaxID=1433469 RepID=A0A9N8VMG6_9GLOM|nr:6901_t:CDS:2 [Cetraspora pellucida]